MSWRRAVTTRCCSIPRWRRSWRGGCWIDAGSGSRPATRLGALRASCYLGRVRTRLPFLLAPCSLLAALAWAAPARADASTWVFVGGGAMGWRQGGSDFTLDSALSFDMGVGTTPDAPFVFGGLFRMTPLLGTGTDLALLARAATYGFQASRFGVALDAGGYARFWGVQSTGFAGALTLGAPLGLTVSLQGSVGTNDALGFGVVAGIDLLRLTLYRQSLLDWWPNPSPGQEIRQDARR
jgi:hypothetical protein